MAIGTNCHLSSKNANTRLIYSKIHQTTRVRRSQCVLEALGTGISCHRGCGTNVTGGFWLQPSMKHGFHHVKLCETLMYAYLYSQDPHSRKRSVSCSAPSKTFKNDIPNASRKSSIRAPALRVHVGREQGTHDLVIALNGCEMNWIKSILRARWSEEKVPKKSIDHMEVS